MRIWCGFLLGTVLSGSVLSGSVLHGGETDEQSAKSTAVTLNYCRASFHRMRKYPTKRVMFEEQSKILNNLNLNGISDQEVVTLYTAVLDEIGRERIADREKVVIKQGYDRAVRRQVLSQAFVLGAEVGTAQYTSAVRTGCSSWWDYRTLGLSRDMDVWKVEKTRMLDVMDKSSKFLDTFWKLAQKKNIPDRWLVREDDLDRLEAALTEANPDVRLRVLQRMERFMECYPPYWYHLARTQQGLGQLFAAAETYDRLARLGDGYFRKDDMLASGLANCATIQAYLRQPGAAETAQRAMEFSNGVWQANLVCARVLQQHGLATAAEDAILRNLDVDIERTQSLTCLVSLYCENHNSLRLVERLNDAEVVADLPMPLLLRCAAELGADRFPPPAFRQIVASLYAYEQTQLGRNQVVFVASSQWDLEHASSLASYEGLDFGEPKVVHARGETQLQFAGGPDSKTRMSATGADDRLQLLVQYPDSPALTLHLQRIPWTPDLTAHAERLNRTGGALEMRSLFAARPKTSFLITNVEMGASRVALWRHDSSRTVLPAGLETVRPASSNSQSSTTSTPVAVPTEARESLRAVEPAAVAGESESSEFEALLPAEPRDVQQ